jgi:hypothetical protein
MIEEAAAAMTVTITREQLDRRCTSVVVGDQRGLARTN